MLSVGSKLGVVGCVSSCVLGIGFGVLSMGAVQSPHLDCL